MAQGVAFPVYTDWIALAESRATKVDGCWLWQGATNDSGYPIITINYRAKRLHRLILAQHLQKELTQHALHKCGNRLCVNPTHLYGGDDKTNAIDTFNHGTVQRGHLHHASKATTETLHYVKLLRAQGKTMQCIADTVGVSLATIHNWLHRKKGGRYA